MSNLSRRGKLRFLVHACLATSFALPTLVFAQDDDDIEEVVVTGSYIRNSAFAQDSNVNTVTATDLFESGSPSMANYIRDLTYTQNTDVVANVLSSQDGGQDAVGASFNLRGLGENSTLTLVNGVRVIDPSITNALPDIAIDRMEVVLDGGSALYGSDAVAGVVNIIPLTQFDGFRARTQWQRDQEDTFEESSASMVWGRSFDNGLSYVGAVDARTKTPLMQYERPREWAKDNGSSSSGNPGVWREVIGADPTLNLYAFHGGTQTSPSLVDPSCGTFNDGYPAHGTDRFNTPSGVLTNNGTVCRFEYTKQFAYSTEVTNYNLYNSLNWEATEWLTFNLTMNNSYRISDGRTTSTTATSTNNRRVLLVRQDHPANPFGVEVSPYNWRMITEMYTHRPSHINDSTGSRTFETHTSNNALKLNAAYEMSDTWSGYTYYSKAERKNMGDSYAIHLGKLQLALAGQGGPEGNEYWNPFGSADPRSPFFVQGVTDNSQVLTDWIFENDPNILQSRDYLEIFETTMTGELFNLPSGPLAMAFGYQWRNVQENAYANPLDAIGHDYNTAIGAPLPFDSEYFSEVRAAFVEVEFPVIETVDVQLAVRHEQFTDFGLDATTPKVSVRWEALPTLALRASWGESFLAPTPTQSRPFVKNENCLETFSGTDPFTGSPMTGSTRCESGNPSLKPETSTIQNLGVTWEPTGRLEGLRVSLDYQEIEYVDRIRTLTEQDTVEFEFQTMLAATGIGAYDTTPGSASRLAAQAWYASRGAGNPVDRFSDFSLDRIYRQAANISSVWIDLFDAKVDYTFSTSNWGTFSTSLSATHFNRYDYEDLTGGVTEALGNQNANSGIAPPLPSTKANLRVNWFMGSQSASVSANYWSDVDYDDRVYDNYGDGWTAPPGGIIEAETRVNARYAYTFEDFFNSEITASIGVNNVFDRRPQRLPILGGFESRLSTPWGRQYWVSLDWTPGF